MKTNYFKLLFFSIFILLISVSSSQISFPTDTTSNPVYYPMSFQYMNFDKMLFKFNINGIITSQRLGRPVVPLKIAITGNVNRKSFNYTIDKTWNLSVTNETRIKRMYNDTTNITSNVSYNATIVIFNKEDINTNNTLKFIFQPRRPAQIEANITNKMPVPILNFSFHFSTIMPVSTTINYAGLDLNVNTLSTPIRLSGIQVSNSGTARLAGYEFQFNDIISSGMIPSVYIGQDYLYNSSGIIFDLEVTNTGGILSRNESFIFDPFATAGLSASSFGTPLNMWKYPGNLSASDDQRAEVATANNATDIGNFSIPASLPSDATVVGIEVDVEGNLCEPFCLA